MLNENVVDRLNFANYSRVPPTRFHFSALLRTKNKISNNSRLRPLAQLVLSTHYSTPCVPAYALGPVRLTGLRFVSPSTPWDLGPRLRALYPRLRARPVSPCPSKSTVYGLRAPWVPHVVYCNLYTYVVSLTQPAESCDYRV